jgi:hypothetical protein
MRVKCSDAMIVKSGYRKGKTLMGWMNTLEHQMSRIVGLKPAEATHSTPKDVILARKRVW